jgi:hypothetical protein
MQTVPHADDLHVGQGPNMEALELMIDEQKLRQDKISLCVEHLETDVPRLLNSRFQSYRVKY